MVLLYPAWKVIAVQNEFLSQFSSWACSESMSYAVIKNVMIACLFLVEAKILNIIFEPGLRSQCRMP
ncbi:MAG: hypothetical protein DA330_10290 [Nitrososphaera sp.]|nr:hypothetical protein [Nitrososphaera sp.]